MAGVMGLERSEYVAAVAPNSGGVVGAIAPSDPSHVPAAMCMHGGPADMVIVNFTDTSNNFETQLKDAGASIAITNKAPITAATLERLPALKLIAVAATGTDCVDKAACAARGVLVSNIRGYAINTVPEHAFALILALRRNVVAYRESVLAGRWQQSGQFCFFDHPIRDLRGSRLGIIGEMFIGAMRRARVEEEAQQLRARVWHADRVSRVSALSSALAHEINQPLCAILSNAQAALANLDRGEVRPEEIREILQDVVRDDKRAADTIRTMRAFLRHDNGGRERIDVAAAMQDVLHLFVVEFRSKAIRIEARLEPDCWTIADKTQIEQVALNLLLNAAAAMESSPAGERLLQLSSARTGDGRIAVKVRDAGVGIAPENLEMVFEPFWTTRKEGLGLGLAICRSIIETHDGNILVEPNADRGVTFRFELAADEGAAAPQPTPLPGAAPEPAAPHVVAAGPVVCVIDDETAVREGVVRLLAAQGWSAACYESADEFLRHRPAADVGCLVLDNHMPGMSGRELQAHLARSGAAIPVVFLSGHGDVSTSVAAMKQGAVDFLLKPVDGGQLVAAVRRALARHASERSRVLELDAGMTRLGKLSARERQVMNEVIRGRLNKQIAADLEIALQTVKQHRARVMQKMGATSLADLVRMCEALLGGMPAAAQPPSATIAPISSTPIAAMPRPARQALPPE